MILLRDTVHQARKFYTCDACYAWLRSNYGENDVNADDLLTVSAAESCRWKIQRGQDYLKRVYVDGGELRTYRARLDMHSLCTRLELFDE